MTKKDLIRRLKKLQDCGDTEIAHGQADDLLLEFINDEKVREAFDDIPKWYA